MAKDPRYKTVKIMLETGNISQFSEIFDIIPRSIVSADIGMNYTRFVNRLKKPELFILKELLTIAHYIGVDKKLIVDLIMNDISSRKPVRKPR
ncbi:MAG TPA: hypothetical protein VIK74_01645 [Parasegetibacter sp.]